MNRYSETEKEYYILEKLGFFFPTEKNIKGILFTDEQKKLVKGKMLLTRGLKYHVSLVIVKYELTESKRSIFNKTNKSLAMKEITLFTSYIY